MRVNGNHALKKGTTKMRNEYWKKFEETGFVTDYLDYVQAKGGAVDSEGVVQNESGNGDRDGVVSDADWGI